MIDNPLLLSGLVLAGANRRAAARADEEDGILTAEEVTCLNLEEPSGRCCRRATPVSAR